MSAFVFSNTNNFNNNLILYMFILFWLYNRTMHKYSKRPSTALEISLGRDIFMSLVWGYYFPVTSVVHKAGNQ